MPKWFLYIGRLEGLSFLVLLLVAMPLKYGAQWPVLVQIMGPVHGALFLGYCAGALMLGSMDAWSWKRQALALVAAVLPCGTFIFERKYSGAKKVLQQQTQ
jgi:integral membrane protein